MIVAAVQFIIGVIFWPLVLGSLVFYMGYYYAKNTKKVKAKVWGKVKTQQEKAQEELNRRLKERKDSFNLF